MSSKRSLNLFFSFSEMVILGPFGNRPRLGDIATHPPFAWLLLFTCNPNYVIYSILQDSVDGPEIAQIRCLALENQRRRAEVRQRLGKVLMSVTDAISTWEHGCVCTVLTSSQCCSLAPAYNHYFPITFSDGEARNRNAVDYIIGIAGEEEKPSKRWVGGNVAKTRAISKRAKDHHF
ncbi:9085_t:CDS:2 [Acaulospora colombiana]|uniref:9085_t:CDS:1 n=1 Tax=Acaulospora colombiana TaxID=27376 RepID=A0ACA9MIY4_9GLOM|nr:9085_t:CDS:2 [Acaulospora colombiana]